MIWHKAYLETRSRFALCVALALFTVLTTSPDIRTFFGGKPLAINADKAARMISSTAPLVVPIVLGIFAVTLAGAGINTQTMSSTRQGVHGSMLFTLSMPVSRRKLVLSRAVIGLGATALLSTLLLSLAWVASPSFHPYISLRSVLTYSLSATVGVTIFYSASVLLATFLDEMWQFYIGCGMVAVAIMLAGRLPGDWNILRIMSDKSIPVIGGIWWPAWAFCIAASALLLYAAVRVVESKDY